MKVGDLITLEDVGILERPVVRLVYNFEEIGVPLEAFVLEREDGSYAMFKLVRKTPADTVH